MGEILFTRMLKKDLKSYTIIGLLILSLISGGTIIIAIQKLNGPFRTDNIYAMYAYISRVFLMLYPVLIWGTEFSNRTINLIKISGRNIISIYFMKLITYFIGILIFMLASFIEVWIYGIVYQVEIELFMLFKNMLSAYIFYGFFLYGLGTCISIFTKNTTRSLIGVFLTSFISTIFCNLLAQMGERFQKIVEYIPFSYAENAFSFANFNINQTINILIFGLILNIIGYLLLEKRGVV